MLVPRPNLSFINETTHRYGRQSKRPNSSEKAANCKPQTEHDSTHYESGRPTFHFQDQESNKDSQGKQHEHSIHLSDSRERREPVGPPSPESGTSGDGWRSTRPCTLPPVPGSECLSFSRTGKDECAQHAVGKSGGTWM